MRSHLRSALDADRTQPEPGEAYIMCQHVHGSPRTGFRNAHVIRTLDGSLRKPMGLTDVMAHEMPPAWWFLCDACWALHENGNDDTEIHGTDGVWPEGATIEYSELEKRK